MRGVAIIVTQDSMSQWRSALSIGSAVAASGARAQLHLHERAVTLVTHPPTDPDDGDYQRAGLPTLADLLETAFALGVLLSACQSGLALVGAASDSLDPRIAIGGLLEFLTSVNEDHLMSL
jgi:predicted peroxiredoxin